MNAADKMQAYANQMHTLAFARANALNEIENLVDFDLDAETMRKEITRIMAKCEADIAAAREAATAK